MNELANDIETILDFINDQDDTILPVDVSESMDRLQNHLDTYKNNQ